MAMEKAMEKAMESMNVLFLRTKHGALASQVNRLEVIRICDP